MRTAIASDIDLITSLSTDLNGGNDDIDSGSGHDIIIGGRSSDTIHAGAGDNIVIGDSGRITAAVDNNARWSGQPITVGLIETITFGDGGSDDITTLGGNDIVFGGHNDGSVGDTTDGSTVEDINAGAGRNIVLGDDGAIDYVRAEREPGEPGADFDASDIDLITSLSTSMHGGVDDITTGGGNDIVIGGRFGDTIDAGNGQNIVLGDSGQLVAADNDLASPWATRRFSIALVTTALDPEAYADGGGDDITTGDGNDLVIGGAGGDTVHGGDGNDLVFGDQGEVRAAVGKVVDTTAFPLVEDGGITFLTLNETALDGSGDDLIYGEAGDDMLMGQQGNDILYGGDDDDDLIGGHNVMGGLDAGDSIDGGTGNDVIAGDNATILRRTICATPATGCCRARRSTAPRRGRPSTASSLRATTARRW